MSNGAAGLPPDFAGRLEATHDTPITFSVEVWRDNPLWTMTLSGLTASGEAVSIELGKNASPFQVTHAGLSVGHYVLQIVATLTDPQGRLELRATSTIDDESRLLRTRAGQPVRMDAMPVLVV
jgi:hypothetical protein